MGAYEKAPYEDVVNYTRATREAFESAGISWCVWNFTATFPFFDLRRKIGLDGELLMAPYADQLNSYGSAKAKVVKDKYVPDGKALEVKSRKGKNPWDSGLSGPIAGEIKRGDTVIMSYWAKVVKGEGFISNAGIQLNSEPYTPLATESAKLSSEWEQFFVSATATRDYKSSEAGYSMQVAGAKQTLRIGPVFVLNLGQNVDINQMPRN